MCQNSDEVRTILNQEATSLDGRKGSPEEGNEDVFTSTPSESAEEKNRKLFFGKIKACYQISTKTGEYLFMFLFYVLF